MIDCIIVVFVKKKTPIFDGYRYVKEETGAAMPCGHRSIEVRVLAFRPALGAEGIP